MTEQLKFSMKMHLEELANEWSRKDTSNSSLKSLIALPALFLIVTNTHK